ncbi:hypothetical protein GFK26_30315 [Variovorax paradoxus]|uniref:Uncharacterized protein n=1 Tax=Variovorax paradoxus TaxID=34073 RepID=A0A5Q0MCG8_VARPD|nr:hypothetical protein [Variovorax paradoxus]QFZ86768.1 hypothetical protein GFK26_30315 [Variovorax paradoxus]
MSSSGCRLVNAGDEARRSWVASVAELGEGISIMEILSNKNTIASILRFFFTSVPSFFPFFFLPA